MIITELTNENGYTFKHIYSSAGYFIKKQGTEELYEEAYEELTSTAVYEETNIVNTNSPFFKLRLTRGDVFRGLFKAKGITRAEIRALIEIMPQETEEEIEQRELALIDFDEALYFYRANPLIDKLGAQLNISSEQMTQFFKTNDYTNLM